MLPSHPQENVESPSPASHSERKMSLRRYGKKEDLFQLPELKRVKKTKAGPGLGPLKQTSDGSEGTGQVREGCKISPGAFQGLLMERKSEVKRKAEEKRQEDLRRILPMNPGIGTDPLALATKEMWSKIMDELKPQDRARMYHVHPFFRDMMKDTLIRDTLLPLVMDYKIGLVERYLVPYVNLDLFSSRPDLTQLMTLRLVSKSLQDAVRKWIENRLLYQMRNSRPGEDDLNMNTVHFEMGETLPQHGGLRQFSRRSIKIIFPYFYSDELVLHCDREGNPFQWRTVLEIFNDFLDYITEFLKTVGDQILHFDLDFHDVSSLIGAGVPLSLERIHRILREWLLLMPNLKWLALNAPMETSDASPNHNQPNWMATVNEIDIGMPTLAELERIDLEGCDEHAIWNAVLIANPQTKNHFQLRKRPCNDIDTYTDPAVLSLSLETVDLGNWSERHWDLPLLQKISSNNCNWKLKRMSLWMNVINDGFIPLDGAFQCIQKHETLEDLDLHIDHVSIGEEINFLRLPNLQDFGIEFGPQVKFSGDEMVFFFSLQFLMHCEKLQELTWENLMYDSLKVRRKFEGVGKEERVMMDFMGGNRDLSKSNIWDVFPQLRCIKVRFREGAQEKNRKYFRRVYRERELVKEDRGRWKPSWQFSVGSGF